MARNIAVIGAGVIGLASAVNILEEIPNVTVTVLADKFSPNTTSDGAAGFWEPHAAADTPEHLQRHWGEVTFRHLEALCRTEESSVAGVTTLSAYHISKEPIKDEFWASTVYNYRQVPTEEISRQYPHAKYGIFFTSFLAECRMYLPWLMRRFKEQGGKVVNKHVFNLEELVGQYDVIVNCTGLHSRSLVSDDSMQPIRGQVVRVKAPWLKHFVYDVTADCAVIPCSNNVLITATAEIGNWNTEPDPEYRKKLWKSCCTIFPSLKHATVDYEWVGLRPGRPSVRLEKEIRKVKDEYLKIVHNYGHGGAGITFHWGCAQDTTALVAELLGRK
ncbi:D-aspartate oxidase-like [Ptychodera flava]|uniref:D-aspartate oxidase-like n=1 Tax=Ptychodera flava TaxID=63121 RepID=UPI00396AABAB